MAKAAQTTPESKASDTNEPVLVIDLDGTLLRTDMLLESFASVLHASPMSLLKIPMWLRSGKARMKQELARRARTDAAKLPYNTDVLDFIRAESARGRKVVLCTASDRYLAEAVAEYLGLFDEVLSSDGALNLSGRNKATELQRRYGTRGFDYAGNSRADFAVWRVARKAIVVSASDDFAFAASKCCEIDRVISPGRVGPQEVLLALRVDQWLKNLLILVPMLASHRMTEPGLWATAVLAFLSFSFCASMAYILNDLINLESDRRHSAKARLMFASGRIPIIAGFGMAAGLGVASLALGALVGVPFLLVLAGYYGVTSAYRFGLKRVVLIDCLVLSGLYLLRIIAGEQAMGLPISSWAMGFSFFLFLSLAHSNRYAGLRQQSSEDMMLVPGTGYGPGDAPIVAMLGVAAGYAAVGLLVIYLTTDAVQALYADPWVLAALIPIVVFWIGWIWLKANRGQMQDDPVIFALKDRVSQIAGLGFAAIAVFAAVGVPW